MNAFRLLVVAALTASSMSAAAAGIVLPARDVYVGINDAYVPGGLNASSDVTVVESGVFVNGCYKWKRAEVKDIGEFTHEIRNVASVTQGMCIMVMIPFTKEIHLGRFAPGTHTLRFVGGDGTYMEKTMPIAP